MLKKMVNGVEVEMSAEEEAQIREEWAKNESEAAKNEYARNRLSEYPTIRDQLDLIYHEGLDSWKDKIKSIKDKYPKPTE